MTLDSLCITRNRLLYLPIGALAIAIGVIGIATGGPVPILVVIVLGGAAWTFDNCVASRICVTSAGLSATEWLGLRRVSVCWDRKLSVDVVPWGFGGPGSTIKGKLVIVWSDGKIELSPLHVYRSKDVSTLINLLRANAQAIRLSPQAISLTEGQKDLA